MRKKILAFLLTVLLISGLAVTAFAASPEVVYDASYDDDTKTVTVSVYVKNAVGTESADLNLAYDSSMFEFQDLEESKISRDVMIVADKSFEDGLCTCSFFFTDSCTDSDLDEDGNLRLVDFMFKPVNEDFDINDFCLWATSYDIEGGKDILSQIKPLGDAKKMNEHTNSVTTPNAGNGNGNNNGGGNGGVLANSNSADGKSSKLYVYIIAGVLAIAAIVGISLIAVKSGREEDGSVEETAEAEAADEKSSDQNEPQN